MKPQPKQQTLSPIPRTISYFTMWGLDYGFIFGFAAGSIAFPIAGTIVGAFLGLFLGGLYGLIVGLGMSAVHRGIEPGTDLDASGRKLVRRTAAALTLLNIVALPIMLPILYRQIFGQAPRFYLGYGDTNLNIFLAAVAALSVVMSFVVAATARHYPHRMAHERPLNAPMAHAFVMRHEMETAFHQIRRRSARWWIPLVVFSMSSLVHLMNVAAWGASSLEDGLIALGFGVFLAYAGVWIGRIYLSLFNAAVLTFIKRVILRDYFPNLTGARYRARVTLIAGLATLIATWWTLFLAPVIALLTAYFVYHTVALPDEMQEKSKRKESAQTPSKVPAALMLPEETDGEIVNHDLSRLSDASTAQQAQQI